MVASGGTVWTSVVITAVIGSSNRRSRCPSRPARWSTATDESPSSSCDAAVASSAGTTNAGLPVVSATNTTPASGVR